MKKKTTKEGSGAMKLLTFGASLASLAATAYFFLGPQGEKNQKQVKSWAIKMKADVIEKLEQLREINEPVYNEIIDSVAAKYEKKLQSSPREIKALAQDLKKHWQTISSSARVKKGAVVKKAIKPIKKTGSQKKLASQL
jgi:hypothetical protein